MRCGFATRLLKDARDGAVALDLAQRQERREAVPKGRSRTGDLGGEWPRADRPNESDQYPWFFERIRLHEASEAREDAPMLIADAQREVRTVYLGGFVGQLVSAMIWFASATVATLIDPKTGFWTLVIGGVAIFPMTQAILRMAGRRPLLDRQNPLGNLAMQIAFTVPLVLPLAGAAALYRPGWFYPACLIIVGAHYLPFVFLYGMKTFAVLAGCSLVPDSRLDLLRLTRWSQADGRRGSVVRLRLHLARCL